MNKPPKPIPEINQVPKKPERDYSYFVTNPDEITVEDVERIEGDSQSSFLNNFHNRIYRKDSGSYWQTQSEEIQREHEADIAHDLALNKAMNEAIQEAGFNVEWFKELSAEQQALTKELFTFFNKHKTPTLAEEERLREVQAKYKMLDSEILPRLLELYKIMRKKGFKHYPDLVA